jgi:hypothetical protein
MNSDPVDLSIAPEFRPLPLWAWNGEMTVERISKTLTDFRDRGFGGAFIHPRPGLITEYLSEKWFELWRFAQETATELRLTVHIYDENSFPSGFAGGHVLAARPELRLNRLVCIAADAHTDGTVVAQFEHVSSHFKIVREPTEKSGWYADGTYVDLLNPETANVFTQLTHHRYDREVNSFGLMAFSDEPAVMDYSRGALPWSETIEEAFAEEHGYRLQSKLPSLFVDVDSQSPKVRYDFQTTLMRLFQINFVEPLASTCEKYGMRLTGHLHEHEWPCPRYQANPMLAMAGFHVPGIDLLGFQVDLSDRSSHGRWLLTILEVTSLADQLGKRTVLCEAYGGGGYETTLADLKRQGDYLLAGGINLLVPHMSYETMVGARKYDWPQTISDHAPFWDDIGPLHEHQARVASILSRGVSTAVTLVLHPTATGWLDWTPDSSAVGREQELPPRTAELRSCYSQFLKSLADRYLDFHLGDEWILEAHGSVIGEKLVVGNHSYSTVVIPPQMETIRSQTLDLLEQFCRAGGTLFIFPELPTRLNGASSEEPSSRLKKFGQLLEATSHIPTQSPIVRAPYNGQVPPGLQVVRRKVGELCVYFVANPWSEPVTAAVEFDAECLLEVDTVRGSQSHVSASQSITLGPGEHRMWIEWTETVQFSPRTYLEVPFDLASSIRTEPNVLTIDQCALNVGDNSFGRSGTIVQNQNLWREHGLPGDPWEWGVQFKRDFVDSALPQSPGFDASYTFACETEVEIQICVERPWLYDVMLNDQPVDFSAAAFFDQEMGLSLPLKPRIGANHISLRSDVLHIHHELAPVWVLGDFAVASGVLTRPSELDLGGWGCQGLENYPWTVEYRGSFFSRALGEFEMKIEGGNYSSAEISVDGNCVARDWGNGGWISLGQTSAGGHELKVRIRGNLRNLLGPFGVEGLPGPWLWKEAAEHGFGPREQRTIQIDAIQIRAVR